MAQSIRIHDRFVTRALVLALVVLLATLALAVHDVGLVEVDGNLVNDTGGAPHDWASLFDSSGTPIAIGPPLLVSGFVADPVTSDGTTHGSNTDDEDVSTWTCAFSHNPQSKTNILNSYAAIFTNTSDGHIMLFMGQEREANEGNAFMGFWLLQSPASCTDAAGGGTTPFTGAHTEGDLLVLNDFTVGGTLSTISIYRWNTSASNNLEVVATGLRCSTSPTWDNVCGEVNTASIASRPWAPSGAITERTFFEVGIDLSAVTGHADDPAMTPCFTTFIGETRVSASLSAQLFDYALGSLNTCGSIVVKKETDPDGLSGTFSFVGALTGSIGHNDTLTLANVQPGVYHVTELVPDGWDLVSITCDDEGSAQPSTGNVTNATATFRISLKETVTCTFTNAEDVPPLDNAIIIVEKQTVPSESDRNFTFVGRANGSIEDDGFIVVPIAAQLPAQFNSTELVPAGWDLTSIVCDDGASAWPSAGFIGNATAIFNLEPDETVTCVFTNTQRGNITIVKQTDPDGSAGQFSFSPDYAGGFSLSDGASNKSEPLQPGSYTVSETVPAGWDVTGIVCDATSYTANLTTATVSINLTAGEEVACTFTDTARGTIAVEKQTDPDAGAGTFTFTPSYATNFTLADGGTNTSEPLAPGVYTVTEADPTPADDLTTISCTGAANTTSLATRTATITLDAGEVAHCTFTNTQRGQIVILKEALPDGDPADFTFVTSYAGNVTLSDGENHTSALLVPGNYSVVEAVLEGWDLTSATCSDESDPSNISLDPGETVTCTFENTKRAKITVEKQTDPDGASGTFTFVPSYAANFTLGDGGANESDWLVPGAYDVTEADPTPTFDLTSISCAGALNATNLTTRTATLALSPGEHATCVFTNTQRSQIVVQKQTLPDGANGTFTFVPSYAGNFTLDDNGTNVSAWLVPGTYTVTEADPTPAFDLTSIVCTGSQNATSLAGRNATLALVPGAHATCVFTNAERGRIVIDKVTVPPGDSTKFTFVPSYGAPFALNDTDPANVSALLPSGVTYNATEVVPMGWRQANVTCSDGGTLGALMLDPGETITCVVINELGPTRTQGFWSTHLALSSALWISIDEDERLLCTKDLGDGDDDVEEMLGGFWSDIAKKSTKAKRTPLDQARMLLVQQLLAAMLNEEGLGTSSGGLVDAGKTVLCTPDRAAILAASSALDTFNNMNDDLSLPSPLLSGKADSKASKALADRAFWDTLP